MKPIVLIRSGGDIASGIIYRLWRAGYPVVVNEIAIPTMIRREVSYGNAVHRGEMILDRLRSRHVLLQHVQDLLSTREAIPVVTEPYAEVLTTIQPTIVVDAILAKRNVGTVQDDAQLVIGCGPGFSAPKDVHVVIETMRGHSLGRCIYEGAAIANTGIPGNVGGYTHERVIHAPVDGLFVANCHIGDLVEAESVIGHVDTVPIKSKIRGILRGILASNILVSKGFKLADVDARCEENHCFTISDKALAIGGGVMEAITSWEFEQTQELYSECN